MELGILLLAFFIVISIWGYISDYKERGKTIKRLREENPVSEMKFEILRKANQEFWQEKEDVKKENEKLKKEKEEIKNNYATAEKELNEKFKKAKEVIKNNYSKATEEIKNDYEKTKKELFEQHLTKKTELDKYKNDLDELKHICDEQLLALPWLAAAYADKVSKNITGIEEYLLHKSRPAINAADIVRKLKCEFRHEVERRKLAEYTIAYYESIFPLLSDIKELDIDDINPTKEVAEEDKDEVLYWLSREEYESLSETERNQRALGRYLKRKKTKREIGSDYERYIGWLYENEGYRVEYIGIIAGFEDYGRDLICKKGKEVIIVQCKCWSIKKVIHEKHINQLYGTRIAYVVENSILIHDIVEAHFVTSTVLSDTAKKFAEYLNIKYKESFPLGDYPRIKCNINPITQERVYHLPFDQQYDRTVILPNTEECYVSTVLEAEEKGFRRAKHWYYTKTFPN